MKEAALILWTIVSGAAAGFICWQAISAITERTCRCLKSQLAMHAHALVGASLLLALPFDGYAGPVLGATNLVLAAWWIRHLRQHHKCS